MNAPGLAGGTVRLEVVPDGQALSDRAAALLVETLAARRHPVVSLTTGRTVAGMHLAMRTLQRRGVIDLRAARLVCSEEYAGVAPADPISLFGWLWRELLAPCGVAARDVLHFRGDAPDPAADCARFDGALRAWGGIDLVVQSAGVNGHFGFNEPGSGPDAGSRLVRLAPSTREGNRVYWPAGTDLPEHGLTLGVAPILRARHVLLLARGAPKATALARALAGPIDPQVPCSLLRLAPRLTVVADETAAARLHAGRHP
jgi:glucosamine-6-phosphate deaminase